jgi:hypothetical protein
MNSYLEVTTQVDRLKAEDYYLNLAPTIYCGLKRLVFKARFMILNLTI